MEKLTSAEIEIEARQLATLAMFWGCLRSFDYRIMCLLMDYGAHFCASPVPTTLQALDDTVLALRGWGLEEAHETEMRERLLRFGQGSIRARLRAATLEPM